MIEDTHVVLHWCACEEHTSSTWDAVQSHGSLTFTVFQAMSLVANHEVTAIFVLRQTPHMCSNGFIACDQNIEHLRLDEAVT